MTVELARVTIERTARPGGQAYWSVACSCGATITMATEAEARALHDIHVAVHVEAARRG